MATTVEGKLQSEIIKWLKSQGAYVIKPRPGPGVPVGCPDILFLFEGAWGAIECKASPTAPYRVGQEPTLARLNNWSPFVYTAYPENWPEIKTELTTLFF
jgi:Holliday junction resolvase